MPPRTVSGKVMRAQMTKMMQIVPNGSAAVDCTCHETHHQNWKTADYYYMPPYKATVWDMPAVTGKQVRAHKHIELPG